MQVPVFVFSCNPSIWADHILQYNVNAACAHVPHVPARRRRSACLRSRRGMRTVVGVCFGQKSVGSSPQHCMVSDERIIHLVGIYSPKRLWAVHQDSVCATASQISSGQYFVELQFK